MKTMQDTIIAMSVGVANAEASLMKGEPTEINEKTFVKRDFLISHVFDMTATVTKEFC